MRLHSSYDPVKEAERYLIGKIPSLNGSPVILFAGPGFGYFYEAVTNICPKAQSIFFFHTEEQKQSFLSRIIANDLDIPPCWSPAEPVNPEQYLYKFINEWDVGRSIMIEWPPAVKAFGMDNHNVLIRSIKTGLEFLKKNLIVTGSFGRKWLINSLKNWRYPKDFSVLKPEEHPVLITASGPTLSDSAEILLNYRNRFRLFALPSSLPFLNRIGVRPDLVITTDAGWWAGLHYQYLPEDVPLFMAISAHPLSKELWENRSVIFFGQDYFWDRLLIPDITGSLPILPSHGTVAGTALFLAESLGSKQIFFAGLDFCFDDIVAHVRPHPFEIFETLRMSRLNPLENALYRRAVQQAPDRIGSPSARKRTGSSLKAYTEWFYKKELTRSRDTLVGRLNPGAVSLPGMQTISENTISSLPVIKEQFELHSRHMSTRKERSDAEANLLSRLDLLLQQSVSSTLVQGFENNDHFSTCRFFDILYQMETASVIQFIKLIRNGDYNHAEKEIRNAIDRAQSRIRKWEKFLRG